MSRQFQFDELIFTDALQTTALQPLTDALLVAVRNRADTLQHGDLPRWQAAIDKLPALPVHAIDIQHEDGIAVLTTAVEPEVVEQLTQALQALIPWRKGPYRIGPVHIDTEWRSDWKWNRVIPHITPLANRTVLDVGCGSGYHLWRMHAEGAAVVLGIDPGLSFNLQFSAVRHYLNRPAVAMLPLPMEAMPERLQCFDSVFSMGILYHRRNPAEHLQQLFDALAAGGELILETLVCLGEDERSLQLDGRYARMRNIWTLPSVALLAKWLHDAGFSDVRCVSVDITSVLEQRTTEWMPYESLQDALDPDDRSLTIEGLPRPRRAVMIANRP